MESHLRRVFNLKAVTVATFIGGPLATTILLTKNYKALGEEENARKTLYVGMAITLLIFILLFAVPEQTLNKIPSIIFPGVYTLVGSLLYNKLQYKKIKLYLEKTSSKASVWQTFGYGMLAMIITLVCLLPIFFLKPTDVESEKSVMINKNVRLLYTDDIRESKIEKIVAVIRKSGFTNDSGEADILVRNETDNYKLSFVLLNKASLSDTAFIRHFNALEDYINYNGQLDKGLEIEFVSSDLTTEYELPELKPEMPRINNIFANLLQYHITGLHTILHNDQVPESDLQKVGNAIKRLQGYFPPNQKIDIIMLKQGTGYSVTFFIARQYWENSRTAEMIKASVEYMQDSGVEKKITPVLLDTETMESREL